MTKAQLQTLSASVVAAVLSLAGCKGRVENGEAANLPPSNQSSESANVTVDHDLVDSLKVRWNEEISLISPALDGRSRLYEKRNILPRLLKELPTESIEQLTEFAIRADGTSLDSEDFDDSLQKALISIYLKNADKAGVIKLIASNCPRYGYSTYIENYFFIVGRPELNDTILLFVDAYRESKTAENKERVLKVLRGAFWSFPPDADDPNLFVDQCEEWYVRNKANLVVNPDYGNLSLPPANGKRPFFFLRSE